MKGKEFHGRAQLSRMSYYRKRRVQSNRRRIESNGEVQQWGR
jgi:hypothetical protein